MSLVDRLVCSCGFEGDMMGWWVVSVWGGVGSVGEYGKIEVAGPWSRDGQGPMKVLLEVVFGARPSPEESDEWRRFRNRASTGWKTLSQALGADGCMLVWMERET